MMRCASTDDIMRIVSERDKFEFFKVTINIKMLLFRAENKCFIYKMESFMKQQLN